MRNYPLFKNKTQADTPINWQKTYVNSLVLHSKSLIDYSNYFLADYRWGSDFVKIMTPENEQAKYNGLSCYSLEKLKYHQYIDTTEEGYYFLNSSSWDFVSDPEKNGGKRIKAGRHIINNNQKESNFDIYKDWDNIVIQPIGYTGFYIMSYYNGKFIFSYTKNAELYYGKEQTVQPVNFNTRFFYKKNFFPVIADNRAVSIPAENYHASSDPNSQWGIQDYQGLIWTDTILNPTMGFLVKKKKDEQMGDPIDPTLSIGEEIIIDSRISCTIEVDKTNSAVYTMTVEGEQAAGQTDYYYPSDSVLYFL